MDDQMNANHEAACDITEYMKSVRFGKCSSSSESTGGKKSCYLVELIMNAE